MDIYKWNVRKAYLGAYKKIARRYCWTKLPQSLAVASKYMIAVIVDHFKIRRDVQHTVIRI